MEVDQVLNSLLPNFDEDILSYLISIVSDMSVDERKSSSVLKGTIAPFLIDSNFVETQAEAEEVCQKISIQFGGSGYSNASANSNISKLNSVSSNDDEPSLLLAPVKMNDMNALKPPKKTYGGVIITSDSPITNSNSDNLHFSTNTQLDSGSIPNNSKQLRKQRKINEQQQRAVRAESLARAAQAHEMAQARMAAIRASRAVGRQGLTGLSLDRFSLPHPSGSGDLLTDASLTLVPGRRYGLIGRNGAGKSTLMRALANYKLEGLSHLRILLVDQHVEGDEDSAMQWLLRADVERTFLLEEEKRLSHFLHGGSHHHNDGDNDGDNSTVNGHKTTTTTNVAAVVVTEELPADLKNVNLELALQECYERMDTIGVNTAEQRAKKILLGLGFTTETMTKPTLELSGGWAMRAALGAALFIKPTLLLLDEPTNHLDLHALVWLETWLTSHFEGMVIVVSHDRFFLNNICTDILELRSLLAGQKKSSLEHYTGDYIMYEATLDERKITQQRARIAYEKEKEKLQEFIAREGKKYDNPSHQSQRRMKMRQLEQLMEIEEVEEDSDVVLKLPTPYCSFDKDDVLIRIQDVAFAWPSSSSSSSVTTSSAETTTKETTTSSSSSVLFSHVDFSISASARIIILGKNGCGKTSLLNLLTGDQDCTSGSVNRHVGSRVTMLQQHHYKGEQLDPNLSAIDHLKAMVSSSNGSMTGTSGGNGVSEGSALGTYEPGTRQEETCLRSYLSNYGLTGHRALIPVKHLSGGQRMRVAMAVALAMRPDVLILDEPTNHLDNVTAAALCDALAHFDGAIIAVSHDESFVNTLMNSTSNHNKTHESSSSNSHNNSHGNSNTSNAVKKGSGGHIKDNSHNNNDSCVNKGEIWIMSKKQVKRFEGTFVEYKRLIKKKIDSGVKDLD